MFAASSLFLFLTTVWMVWADFDREWKGTQRRFNELQIEVTRAQLQQTQKGVNATKLPQLEQQLASARQLEQTNKAKIDEINARLKEVDQRPLPRHPGGAVRQGQIRRRPLRVRSGARQEGAGRGRAPEGD